MTTTADPSGVDRSLKVGEVVAGRYTLIDAVPTTGPASLWRAHDDVLARTVAVRVLSTPTKAARDAAQPFLDAAVRSGQVNHPGLTRVYDAALSTDRKRGQEIAFLIREWVEGEPLDVHLRQVGALAGPDASDVLRQLADAVTALHERGMSHGRVHPGNVIVTPNGRVRLSDAVLAAVLSGVPAPAEPDDTRGLAAVLYALVTTRWPDVVTGLPGGLLQAAPMSGDRPLSPHQVLAGVPRSLDSVVFRGLQLERDRQLLTPAALADATDAAVADLRAATPLAAASQRPSRVRRAIPWLLALAVISAVGVAGWLLGTAVGTLDPRQSAIDEIVTATDAPTPGAARVRAIDLSRVPIKDFDPYGDKQENSDKVHNAVDDLPETTWPTSTYTTADFGGTKPGVGLLLDLGTPRSLATVRIGFSAPGASLELRVADAAPTSLDGTRLVAADRKGDQVATLRPLAGTKARYVVIWLTQLPQDGKGYRVGISELRMTEVLT